METNKLYGEMSLDAAMNKAKVDDLDIMYPKSGCIFFMLGEERVFVAEKDKGIFRDEDLFAEKFPELRIAKVDYENEEGEIVTATTCFTGCKSKKFSRKKA